MNSSVEELSISSNFYCCRMGKHLFFHGLASLPIRGLAGWPVDPASFEEIPPQANGPGAQRPDTTDVESRRWPQTRG